MQSPLITIVVTVLKLAGALAASTLPCLATHFEQVDYFTSKIVVCKIAKVFEIRQDRVLYLQMNPNITSHGLVDISQFVHTSYCGAVDKPTIKQFAYWVAFCAWQSSNV